MENTKPSESAVNILKSQQLLACSFVSHVVCAAAATWRVVSISTMLLRAKESAGCLSRVASRATWTSLLTANTLDSKFSSSSQAHEASINSPGWLAAAILLVDIAQHLHLVEITSRAAQAS